MKLGLMPEFSSSDLSSPASKIDRNGIVLRVVCIVLRVLGCVDGGPSHSCKGGKTRLKKRKRRRRLVEVTN